jgi:hypothetical protein
MTDETHSDVSRPSQTRHQQNGFGIRRNDKPQTRARERGVSELQIELMAAMSAGFTR